jgi:hypothetical protein
MDISFLNGACVGDVWINHFWQCMRLRASLKHEHPGKEQAPEDEEEDP